MIQHVRVRVIPSWAGGIVAVAPLKDGGSEDPPIAVVDIDGNVVTKIQPNNKDHFARLVPASLASGYMSLFRLRTVGETSIPTPKKSTGRHTTVDAPGRTTNAHTHTHTLQISTTAKNIEATCALLGEKNNSHITRMGAVKILRLTIKS